MGRGVLFISTSYSGLTAYSQAVINSLWDEDSHAVILLMNPAHRSDFDHLPPDRVHIFDWPKGWLASKVIQLHPRRLIKEVERLIAENDLRVVLSVSIDFALSHYVKRIQRKAPFIYIAHNVEPHEASFPSIGKRIFHRYWFVLPQLRLLRNTPYKITNALWQQRKLRELYPTHRIEYIDFPSLVVRDIAEGRDCPPETSRLADGYILFFGTVERYKGIERFLEIYKTSPLLQRHHFVIAGRGRLYPPLADDLKGKVTHINRFISDTEIANLFRRSSVVIYPYLSATQSGVLSIASYFGKPMVVSDVEYFKEIATGEEGVRIVDFSDNDSVTEAVMSSIENPVSSRSLYDKKYTVSHWRSRFNEILDSYFPTSSTDPSIGR